MGLPPSPGASLFGRSREAVIGLLFSEPGVSLHVREIARRAGFSAPTIAMELRNLGRAGVLVAEEQGRQLHYKANPAFPLYEELKAIAVKTWGIQGRIASAISRVPGVLCAFIFGSFAKGTAHAASDIDLLVIGTAEFAIVAAAATEASGAIGRPVGVQLYRDAEWKKKLGEGNRFVTEVAAGPKIFVVGDEEVLDALGKSRKAGGAKAHRRAPSHATRNRKPPGNGAGLRRGGKHPRSS